MQALLDAIAAMPLPVEAQRVFHGRGGLHPGSEQWSLDAYPPVFVLTSFAPAKDEDLAAIGAALQARWAQIAPAGEPLSWVFQHRGEALRMEGRSETRLMAGAVPDPHVVTEAGARYRVHVLRGQNHGLFLDMAEGRRWVRDHAAARSTDRYGLKVLNLFAYTCAFSVVALQAGARLYEVGPLPRPTGRRGLLHTKVFLIDGRQAVVGSLNFDLRSAFMNTELGVLFEEPEVFAELSAMFDRETAPDQAHRLSLASGRLCWSVIRGETDELVRFEPDSPMRLRAVSWVVGHLPIQSYL